MALVGVKVLELAGLAPVSFCGMILADFGATVIKIDKIESKSELDILSNGKKSMSLNLKNASGVKVFKKLCRQSDVLIESYRPGVMEKFSLGPNILMEENPRLIYARLSGYGQDSSYSDLAAHDINILSLTGLLSLMKRKDQDPTPPINLIGGLGGGSLMCAFGIVSALFARNRTGKGQIVDAGMVQGTSYFGSWVYRSQKISLWQNPTGENVLDCGTHFYNTYKTKDGKYLAVGCIEPSFYKEFLKILELNPNEFTQHGNYALKKEKLDKIFLKKTQDEWIEMFQVQDACVTPVLSLDEAVLSKQNVETNTFQVIDGDTICPNPAPKLSETPAVSVASNPAPCLGQNTIELLKSLLGYSDEQIFDLEKAGAIRTDKNIQR